MSLPVRVDPVKERARTSMWWLRTEPETLPNPVTTLMTPGGKPASLIKWPILADFLEVNNYF